MVRRGEAKRAKRERESGKISLFFILFSLPFSALPRRVGEAATEPLVGSWGWLVQRKEGEREKKKRWCCSSFRWAMVVSYFFFRFGRGGDGVDDDDLDLLLHSLTLSFRFFFFFSYPSTGPSTSK